MKSYTLLRLIILFTMIVVAVLFMALLHVALDREGYAARMLLDRRSTSYPMTVQNVMWIVFFIGAGELLVRLILTAKERGQLSAGYLPEDPHAMLHAKNLVPVYQRVVQAAKEGHFLPRLIQRVILLFQSTKATDQAHSLLNSSLDLFMHELELGYNMLRYIMWLIPSLGFIGTVKGISDALDVTGAANPQSATLLTDVTKSLAVAFDTTLLALLMASLLLLIMHIIQGREESTLNRSGQYCLDHLISRLHVGN
jgi:biopolymer transport protein ExbB/TolQ